jgi:hypothetical protein
MDVSPRTDRTGPWVTYAAFCERVLQEADGAVTLVRVVNRIVRVEPLTPPEQPVVALPTVLALAISLKAGSALGTCRVTLQTVSPSGIRAPEQAFDVLFESEDRGVNLILWPILINTEPAGLTWVDLRADGELLSRVPLRVVVQRIASGR